jgi:3D (Asp-Asp-Asp) domain-containing protein
MKKIHIVLVLAFSLVCISYTKQIPASFFLKPFKALQIEKGSSHTVTATMYYPVVSQCDSDPLITAGMFKIDPDQASEQKWIAMSRDLIARWGGDFKYGDLVEISGAGHKDGVYRVVDTMNKRFKNRIDFLETKGTKNYKFDNVTITKITWKTSQNLYASI